MKTELFYLALAATLTGVLWLPSILDRVLAFVGGFVAQARAALQILAR